MTWFKINSTKELKETLIKESPDVGLLGLVVDKKLSFKKILQNYTKQRPANSVHSTLTLEKNRILGNAFVDSQFNYEPLIWVSCKITLRILRIIYHSDECNENLLR